MIFFAETTDVNFLSKLEIGGGLEAVTVAFQLKKDWVWFLLLLLAMRTEHNECQLNEREAMNWNLLFLIGGGL